MIAELDLTKSLQWLHMGWHQVGRAALVRRCGLATPFYDDDCLLVRHAHTGELELVPLEELSQYPSEPIPEP